MSGIGDNYFQFPLCALAFCATEKERLEHVIEFGFVDAGFTMFQKLDQDMRRLKAREFSDDSDTPRDFCKTNLDHVATMLGARGIGIIVGSVRHSLERWRMLSEFRNQSSAKYGPDAELRIRQELASEVCDQTGISYREFAVLCAV